MKKPPSPEMTNFALVREIQLSESELLGSASGLIHDVTRVLARFAPYRKPARDALRAAIERDERLIMVDLALPVDAPAALFELTAVLEKIDSWGWDNGLRPHDGARS